MSLFERKPRPIPTRDKDPDSLRDDRLFIVACDDTYAPQQCFGFFRLTRVKIHVVPTLDGTSAAEHVLERLLSFEFEEGMSGGCYWIQTMLLKELICQDFSGPCRPPRRRG